jgi:hypothetical protein
MAGGLTMNQNNPERGAGSRGDPVSEKGMAKHTFENSLFIIKWKGFLYIPGCLFGIESAAFFCDILRTFPIQTAVTRLRGCFFAELFDKREKTTFYFTDNSGMHKAYHSNNIVNTSLIDIARELMMEDNDIAIDSIIEYLINGYLPSNKSFFRNVRKLDYKTILKVDMSGTVQVITKSLFPITFKISRNNLLDNLNHFFDCIKDENISIDITGGFDTRLLVSAALKRGVDFHLGTTGMAGNPDMEIAKQIAQLIGKPILAFEHDINDLENEIDCILKESHGELDPITYHRLYKYNLHRKQNGATVAVSGAGGELYTDMFWIQDFPFYWSKKSNIDRLYSMRLEPIINENLFEESTVQTISDIKSRTIELLKMNYQADRNTRTYDNIRYFHWAHNYQADILTMNNNYICQYSPLREFTNANFGYHLARRERFYHRFHRKAITSLCPELAKVKTIYGITASSDFHNLVFDAPFYLVEKMKKYITYKFQSYPEVNNPIIFEKARELPETKASLDMLKNLKVLKKKVSLDDMPDKYLGRMLAVRNVLKEVPFTGKSLLH